jgi:hypothetical protein
MKVLSDRIYFRDLKIFDAVFIIKGIEEHRIAKPITKKEKEKLGWIHKQNKAALAIRYFDIFKLKTPRK